jgi:acyl dehydratase
VSRLVSTVDADKARAYAAATNDRNSLYADGRAVPPVFGVVPTWDALFGIVTATVPPEQLPLLLHAEQDMRFHRPLVPGMTLWTEGSIFSVRALRSGTWLTMRVASEDPDGAPVLEQFATMFVRGWSGLEDSGPDRPAHKFPEDARSRPVAEVVRHVDDDQTFRYRDASGDTNPIHVDEEYATRANLPGIIVHGLCTMAMCGSVVVDSACGGDPARLARLAVRFSKPVFPGSDLAVSVYESGPSTYAFEAVSGGALVVRDGLAEVRPAWRERQDRG